ncbi:MAG: hypothetical protein DMG21_10670 [Acidobacteria bacterium]|nr:MAG: hypothetical protein DMG21_10670 [Acidobacteriota bacterium]
MKFFDCDAMVGQTIIPLPSAIPDARALLAEMDRLEIEKTLFFHYAFSMDQKNDMNRLTLAAARESSRLMPTWVLSTVLTRMDEKLEDQVERLLDSGAKAARIFVDEGSQEAGPLSLKLYLLEKLYARLNQHRIPLLIPDDYLNGIGTPSSEPPRAGYEDIDAICQTFPDLPVVLLDPHYNSQQYLIALAERHKNFYFSIAMYGLFHEMENTADPIGAERMLFGTGMPTQDPSLGMGMILYAAMSDGDKQMIAAGNLARLLESVG